MRILALAPALLLGLLGSPTAAQAQFGDDHYSEPRAATLQATGAKLLSVEARAGDLRIEGHASTTEVKITGMARASRKSDLKDIKLVTSRKGDELHVVVDIPDHYGWGNNYRGLDLVIHVPKTLALDVEDGSGGIQIRNVGSIEIQDGSGELHIRGVQGNVRIRDGSGEIQVTNVSGDLVVDSDGSGEIVARDIHGNFHIESDGSGSIRATDIGGSFIVDRDGSGGIEHDGVKGTVSVPEDRRASRKRRS